MNHFEHIVFTEEQEKRSCDINTFAGFLLRELSTKLKDGQEKMHAIERLDECVMWAHKAISKEK